jgi:hypothetical protein
VVAWAATLGPIPEAVAVPIVAVSVVPPEGSSTSMCRVETAIG